MEDFKKPPVADPSLEAVSDDERLWALLGHLSWLVGLGVLAPLIIWLIKKDTSAFVEDQAKEALNFQLSCLVVALVTGATCLLLPVSIVIAVAGIVYSVIAGIESYKGQRYRYPYTFRMVK